MVRPWEPVLVLSRLSYAAERYDVMAQDAQSNEFGAYVNVDGRIASWLHVRAALLWRTPIAIQGVSSSDQSSGLVASFFLAGVL